MITVVTGLPRSGTSLMMQMLEAGGMPILTDGLRRADPDNPNGYYEYEPVKHLREDASWLAGANGKAVKVIYALLPDLPPGYDYRVILMRRNLSEVLASQAALLKRRQAPGATIAPDALGAAFATDLARILARVSRRSEFHVLEIEHQDCIQHPDEVAAQVNQFLGGSLDTERMTTIPQKILYRNRTT